MSISKYQTSEEIENLHKITSYEMREPKIKLINTLNQ
jgi:hypothetical protein